MVVGSGLTIAGAILCLHFTRLPVYQTLGIPTAVGMVAAVAVAVTSSCGHRGGRPLWAVRAQAEDRGSGGGGKSARPVVRWPRPILVATCAVSLIGLLALPAYKPSYNDQKYIRKTSPPMWAMRRPPDIFRSH